MERPETIADAVERRAGDHQRGIVFEERTWTWAEVHEEAVARAHLLRSIAGAGPPHVGVLLDNAPEYVFLLFGAALAGTTVVGINPTRRGPELARDITHTDCQAIFTDRDHAELLHGLDLGIARDAIRVIDDAPQISGNASPTGAKSPMSSLPRTRRTVEAPAPETLYLLIFTAGSTGAPKAVRMSQGRAAATAVSTARAFGPEDVLYCAMPLFHGNALVANLFPALIAGATVVLRRRFSASGFLPDIRRYRCTYFNYVGRTLSYVLSVPETSEDSDNALRWALGSEAAPRDIAEFTRRFGCPVVEGYGSSENAVVIQPSPGTPPGALGRPRKGMDVTIVNPDTGEDGVPAEFDAHGHLTNPADAIGEIVGRNTSTSFEGYYNNPAAEAERTRGGWYWTGDLGYRDAEGTFYFAGRTADWLRVDGENFSAGSVEAILRRYQSFDAVAVYGVPDAVSGDQVMAAAEFDGTTDGGAFDADAFETFLREQPDLGTKWAPRFVRITRALPVTGAGKLDKVSLRAQGWDVDDPVWWRPDRRLRYRRLTARDAGELRARERDPP